MFGFLVKLLSFANINNSLFIEEQNALNLSYTLGENQFIDHNYTDEFLKDNSMNFFMKDKGYMIDKSINDDKIVPLEVDWRKKNKVSSVKNQEKCGGCWAFSASEAVEGIWAIKNNVLYNLSQQELLDCSGMYGNKGCGGGSMDGAFKYIMNNGLCTNISYPYMAVEGECQKDSCESVVRISNYTDINQNDEKILKRAVAQQPVSVAIQANKRSFQLYQSGIYNDLECGTNLDHGVLIVGYGYSLEQDMKYWIIKNSWGINWGENGYIRIQRDIDDERGLCGIAMNPSIPII